MQTADLKVSELSTSTRAKLDVKVVQPELPFSELQEQTEEEKMAATIEAALTSEDWYERTQAVKKYPLTTQQKERALKDRAWSVREAAAELGGLTQAQILRGVDDESMAVREAVIRSK